MSDGFLLFFTGETRKATDILQDQDRRTRELDATMVANLDRTKEIGLESRTLLEAGEPDGLRPADARALAQQARALDRHDHRAGSTTSTSAPGAPARSAASWSAPAAAASCSLYAPEPGPVREAMAGAGAPEVRFGFDFHGCFGQEYA